MNQTKYIIDRLRAELNRLDTVLTIAEQTNDTSILAEPVLTAMLYVELLEEFSNLSIEDAQEQHATTITNKYANEIEIINQLKS